MLWTRRRAPGTALSSGPACALYALASLSFWVVLHLRSVAIFDGLNKLGRRDRVGFLVVVIFVGFQRQRRYEFRHLPSGTAGLEQPGGYGPQTVKVRIGWERT